MPVGIIGLGMAGGAMYRRFKASGREAFAYDSNAARSPNGLEETLRQDVVLLALPTPVSAAGSCDLSTLHSILENAASLGAEGLLVLRSTVPVGTTDRLIATYPSLRIGFSPEFLRERSADADVLNPPMILYGGADPETYFGIWEGVCHSTADRRIVLAPKEAELVKLVLNGFAALKAVFFSEAAHFSRETGLDWGKVVATAKLEGRLGDGYLAGAGSDQLPGYGGRCLPKDTRMLAAQLGPGCLLEAVIERNDTLRTVSAGHSPA